MAGTEKKTRGYPTDLTDKEWWRSQAGPGVGGRSIFARFSMPSAIRSGESAIEARVQKGSQRFLSQYGGRPKRRARWSTKARTFAVIRRLPG